MKRVLARPWGKKRNGGWIISRAELIEALKKAEVADIGGIKVGTKNLKKILSLLPHEHCLIKTNGNLEVETIAIVYSKQKASYRKPTHGYHSFRLFDGAWIPRYMTYGVVIIKPRKF